MMSVSKPIVILIVVCMMMMGVAALAESGAQGAAGAQAQALVLDELASVAWIEKSDVAALREGVIEKMELQIGMPVTKNGVIGSLHQKVAELTVKKTELQAESIAPAEKADAQKEVALSVVARNKRLNERKPGMVSAEDVAKAEGELKVAEAQLHEAQENRAIADAELKLADQTLEEHTIRAPFDGIIIKRMKNPGESVRASEAVVQLGNLAKLCANAYVPLEYAYRVKEGQVVEIQPRITGIRGAEPLPIEKKRFRGKITFVDPEIQPVSETAVRIRAEFQNAHFELRPGLKVQMTIYLTPEAAASAADVPGSTRTAAAQ